MTVKQLATLADALEARFKENPSLFTLTDPPRHSMRVQLSPVIDILFKGFGKDIMVKSTQYGELEVSRPYLMFHPISWYMHLQAAEKLWKIAEELLGNTSSRGDKLLYDLFPEMLENNINKK